MSMFGTFGTALDVERKPGTMAKLERLRKTFAHEEADRVPISDCFWGSFRKRWIATRPRRGPILHHYISTSSSPSVWTPSIVGTMGGRQEVSCRTG
jgi:hypothetical protein